MVNKYFCPRKKKNTSKTLVCVRSDPSTVSAKNATEHVAFLHLTF